MRVFISNYRNHWISPYTMIERVFFWTDWSRCSRQRKIHIVPTDQWVDHPEWVDRWADRLEPVSRAIQWTLDRVFPRRVRVRIDPWDTWSMDVTLAEVVLPMLRQLRQQNQGAPFVDDDDVPEHLRSTAAPPKANEWDTDANHFKRWDWVMDEMIFAFQSKVDSSWEEQFHSGEYDWALTPVDEEGNPVPRGQHKFVRMDRGPDHTAQFDADGYQIYADRIQNGFRLFGKYYSALWS